MPTLSSFPSPDHLCDRYPLSQDLKEKISTQRQEVKNSLFGGNGKLLLIMGPCSIHDYDSTLLYAEKLLRLSEEVSDVFYIVMRTYVEKARSIKGWKGFLYDPYLDGTHAVEKGITLSRQLFIELTKMGIPLGGEILDPFVIPYLQDLFSWGCIGARTGTSQPHRQLASNMPFPVGFKNSLDGNLENAIHGIISASSPHVYLGLNQKGYISPFQSQGNLFCHLVLRGSDKGVNYDPSSINRAVDLCNEAEITPSLLVDCSHDNSGKKHEKQVAAFQSVIAQYCEGNKNIRGLMLESNLEEGNQQITNSLRKGVSITDPCLGWKDSELLIRNARNKILKELLLI